MPNPPVLPPGWSEVWKSEPGKSYAIRHPESGRLWYWVAEYPDGTWSAECWRGTIEHICATPQFAIALCEAARKKEGEG